MDTDRAAQVNLLSNVGNLSLSGAGNDGHASGTTQSAVSDGTIVVRDTAAQQQNINDLSRDTEHANDSISPIFDKEKEQNRLKQAQLIGEIGVQAMDIARMQGEDYRMPSTANRSDPIEEQKQIIIGELVSTAVIT